MDLSVPMIDDRGKEHIDNLITEDLPEFNAELFIQLYNEDKLGGMIRNVDVWLNDIFTQFQFINNKIVKGYDITYIKSIWA